MADEPQYPKLEVWRLRRRRSCHADPGFDPVATMAGLIAKYDPDHKKMITIERGREIAREFKQEGGE